MTLPAFPVSNTIQPSITSTLQQNYNRLESQFGGNYIQLAAAGINPIVPTWNLEFDNLNAADSVTLETFLNSVGFGYFTWTPPSGPGSVWWLNQSMNSYGFQKTNNGLVNSYQFSVTMLY
jgi:phage-related protein